MGCAARQSTSVSTPYGQDQYQPATVPEGRVAPVNRPPVAGPGFSLGSLAEAGPACIDANTARQLLPTAAQVLLAARYAGAMDARALARTEVSDGEAHRLLALGDEALTALLSLPQQEAEALCRSVDFQGFSFDVTFGEALGSEFEGEIYPAGLDLDGGAPTGLLLDSIQRLPSNHACLVVDAIEAISLWLASCMNPRWVYETGEGMMSMSYLLSDAAERYRQGGGEIDPDNLAPFVNWLEHTQDEIWYMFGSEAEDVTGYVRENLALTEPPPPYLVSANRIVSTRTPLTFCREAREALSGLEADALTGPWLKWVENVIVQIEQRYQRDEKRWLEQRGTLLMEWIEDENVRPFDYAVCVYTGTDSETEVISDLHNTMMQTGEAAVGRIALGNTPAQLQGVGRILRDMGAGYGLLMQAAVIDNFVTLTDDNEWLLPLAAPAAQANMGSNH